MIAISIMAAVTLLTQQSIRSGILAKTKVDGAIEEETKIQDAIRLMQKDISLAFHFIDYNSRMNFEIQSGGQQPTAATTGQAAFGGQNMNQFQPAGGITPSSTTANPSEQLPPLSQFRGDAEQIYFTTLNNRRSVENAKEADVASVGYFLKNCQRPSQKDRSTTQSLGGRCLWRKIHAYLPEDPTLGGTDSVIIENVETLKFRFFGPNQTEWMSRWNSGLNGEDFSKGKFPLAVEIQMTVLMPNSAKDKSKPRKISKTVIAPIRFPNNEVNAQQPQQQGPRDVKF